jgi:glycosyltransferase involved in cell wall biosynthesis
VIVHVTDVFTPGLGGIEVQVGALARAQREVGEEVHVVTASPDRQGALVGELPYPVHRVDASCLRGILEVLCPRTIHIHVSVLSPFAWTAARVACDRAIPAVLTVHSMWDAPVRPLYRLLALAGGWHRHMVFTAVSTVVSRQVASALPPGTRIETVPNGIDPSQWTCTGHYPGRGGSGLHIVSVGRLARRRQPLALLRVLREAQARLGPQVAVRATIVGAGPMLPAVRRYLVRNKMDGWVCLTGARDQGEVREVLAAADVYVNATTREAFGLATLEARTVGIPVIARTGTGVADFVDDGREGLLGRSMEDLVQQVVRIGRDNVLREQIGTRSRSTRPAASCWPWVLERLEHCYGLAALLAQSRGWGRP